MRMWSPAGKRCVRFFYSCPLGEDEGRQGFCRPSGPYPHQETEHVSTPGYGHLPPAIRLMHEASAMAHLPTDTSFDITAAVNALVTEDDEPVDNVFSEKQQRLLTEPLYSSWTPPPEEEQPGHPRPFWAAAHVGIFPSLHQPPLVPDVFVSLDVAVADNMFEQRHRSYFFWEFGKAPEVVIEIVSNRKSGELSNKRRD